VLAAGMSVSPRPQGVGRLSGTKCPPVPPLEIPPELRDRISKVTNKRARRLLELILEHGEVTTEQLTEEYGYNHPPRAKRPPAVSPFRYHAG
jgi:hypothetical protein